MYYARHTVKINEWIDAKWLNKSQVKRCQRSLETQIYSCSIKASCFGASTYN